VRDSDFVALQGRRSQLSSKASRGSHRRAVRSHATGFSFSLNPLTWASGGVFLISAISEYGFDIDFPLTPTLWLAIAVCAVLVTCVARATTGAFSLHAIAGTAVIALLATGHGAVCSRQHQRRHSPPAPHTRLLQQLRVKRARTDNSGPRPPVESGIVGRASLLFRLPSARNVINVRNDTIPVVKFLNPARVRGTSIDRSHLTAARSLSHLTICS